MQELIESKVYFNDEQIVDMLNNGMITKKGAILFYFSAKFRTGKPLFFKEKTIADKLNLKYDTVRHIIIDLKDDGVLYHDKCKSRIVMDKNKRWVRQWHMEGYDLNDIVILNDVINIVRSQIKQREYKKWIKI